MKLSTSNSISIYNLVHFFEQDTRFDLERILNLYAITDPEYKTILVYDIDMRTMSMSNDLMNRPVRTFATISLAAEYITDNLGRGNDGYRILRLKDWILYTSGEAW